MSKKCTHCKTHSTETMKEIPLVAAECEATRQHKIICRLILSNILLVVLLGSYIAFDIYGEQQQRNRVQAQITEHVSSE